MKRLRYLLFFGLLFLGTLFAQAQHPFKRAIQNYREFLVAQDQTPKDTLTKWIGSLSEIGQWPDVAYGDKTSSTWKTRIHLDRVVKLSIAFQKPKSAFTNKREVWNAIVRSSSHWAKFRYQNPNWWHNEIGVPQFWRDIITLNFEHYEQNQLTEALSLLKQFKLKENFTGANLTWSADLALHYGLFTSNDSLVVKARNLLIKEIKLSNGEGIKPDFSYHQHGARLQTHHYGEAFLTENIRLAYELHQTPWQFPIEKITIMTNFLIKGWQWMSRGKSISPATLDRAVSRPGALSKDISMLLPYLIALDLNNAKPLQAMLKVQEGSKQLINGFNFFTYSDFGTLQQDNFSILIKTISTRTEVSEQNNGENQQGTFLNLGNTYLIRNGKEYFDLMPVWDWTQLPGTTNFKSAKRIVPSNFAGGLVAGKNGLIAMDFETDNEQSSLKGQKFWVIHNGQLFCLINGLKLTNGADSIYTVLEQSRLQGPVLINRGNAFLSKQIDDNNPIKWVHHNGFSYVPLTGVQLAVTSSTVTGSWQDVSKAGNPKVISERVFKVLAQHENVSTAAFLIDGKTKTRQLNKLLAKPGWKIVNNDVNCQALAFKDGIIFVSFHREGSRQIGNYKVKVNKPCLFIISNDEIFASDPLFDGADLTIEINDKIINLKLPKNGGTINHKLG